LIGTTEVVPFPNRTTIARLLQYAESKNFARLQLLGSSVYAQQNAPSAHKAHAKRQQAAAEEDSFEKRSFRRFFAITLKPFEEPCPRMQASWPRPISGIEPVSYLMPDERQEIRIKRPASHTTLDGLSFIPWVLMRRKGMFTKLIRSGNVLVDHKPVKAQSDPETSRVPHFNRREM
jgi:hypothetical protein